MTILVTGGTGTVGRHLLDHLSNQGLDVQALTRNPGKATLPKGVTPVAGDLLDVESMRSALAKTRTLFLLNPVVPEELSQTLLTLNLAREAGVQGIVYFSIFTNKAMTNVPHCASKHMVEQMIEQFDIPATILRPNCFMQNDVMFKDALLGPGVYPFPIGGKGVSMVDARDIANIAAGALSRRERAAGPLPRDIINVVGPEPLTGVGNAAIWSKLLRKPVEYAGDDTAPFEKQAARNAPGWAAMDVRLMLDRFQQDGLCAATDDVEQTTRLLGRPPRSYAQFASETLARWQN